MLNFIFLSSLLGRIVSRLGAAPVLALALVVAGCAVPRHGPSLIDMELQQPDNDGNSFQEYALLRLDGEVVRAINYYVPQAFPSEFGSALGAGGRQTVGIGDQLLVNIWEASGDGLFSTVEKKQTTLQTVVDETGGVFIPYVGRVQAANRSVESVRRAIEQGLIGKAIEPQVQVIVAENQSSTIVVVGDVQRPGQYPVPIRGIRLMEAIANAGGTREAAFEAVATVTRGSRSGTVRLDDVMRHQRNNIGLQSGDNVLVLNQPRTYSAFGAVQRSDLVPFKSETLTLAEALAQVGGLRDNAAAAGGVFLFRREPADLAYALAPKQWVDSFAGEVPVIYRLDFSQPRAFFLARDFRMRDKDVIYVASHPSVELSKLLSILGPLLNVTRSAVTLAD